MRKVLREQNRKVEISIVTNYSERAIVSNRSESGVFFLKAGV